MIKSVVAFAAMLALGMSAAPAPEPVERPAVVNPFGPGGIEISAAGAVDTALILAVDISQSMDDGEQRVQRDGYVAAIASPEFIRAVQGAGRYRQIAMAFVEWGGVGEQFVVVDWRVIGSEEEALEFADDLGSAPINRVQRTSISDAINFSAGHFRSLQVPADRFVIDVSGDGPNNQGGAVVSARDAAVAQGIIINGLPLMIEARASYYHLPNLDHYYEDCVIGGPGAFVIPVRTEAGFAEAIQTKLIQEVAAAPPVARVVPVARRSPVPCNMFD